MVPTGGGRQPPCNSPAVGLPLVLRVYSAAVCGVCADHVRCLCQLFNLPAPLTIHPRLAGPSSPRGNTWAHGRGTVAEAAANALSKGSPRGVTPNHSALALAAAVDKQAAAGGASVASIQSKLQKLTVGRRELHVGCQSVVGVA